MTLRILLSVLEIVALVAVLAFFLRRLAVLLGSISENLEAVAAGVSAVEGHCQRVGPGVTQVNGLLAEAAAGLDGAAVAAESLAGRGR